MDIDRSVVSSMAFSEPGSTLATHACSQSATTRHSSSPKCQMPNHKQERACVRHAEQRIGRDHTCHGYLGVRYAFARLGSLGRHTWRTPFCRHVAGMQYHVSLREPPRAGHQRVWCYYSCDAYVVVHDRGPDSLRCCCDVACIPASTCSLEKLVLPATTTCLYNRS